jgi:hypothetical protein
MLVHVYMVWTLHKLTLCFKNPSSQRKTEVWQRACSWSQVGTAGGHRLRQIFPCFCHTCLNWSWDHTKYQYKAGEEHRQQDFWRLITILPWGDTPSQGPEVLPTWHKGAWGSPGALLYGTENCLGDFELLLLYGRKLVCRHIPCLQSPEHKWVDKSPSWDSLRGLIPCS